MGLSASDPLTWGVLGETKKRGLKYNWPGKCFWFWQSCSFKQKELKGKE
jgi:hypothetical protein